MSEAVSYEAKLKSFYGTGRRKHSVARVRLYPGSGNVTINGRAIDDYFGLETLKLIVRQPLELTETAAQFDVVCTVKERKKYGLKAARRAPQFSKR